jgi:hypothetical protein
MNKSNNNDKMSTAITIEKRKSKSNKSKQKDNKMWNTMTREYP